jgi:hypothetical protein
LENIISLIAYSDPFNCPISYYLGQEQRDFVAETLNKLMLKFWGFEEESILEKLSKQSNLVRELMVEQKMPFASWSLGSILS